MPQPDLTKMFSLNGKRFEHTYDRDDQVVLEIHAINLHPALSHDKIATRFAKLLDQAGITTPYVPIKYPETDNDQKIAIAFAFAGYVPALLIRGLEKAINAESRQLGLTRDYKLIPTIQGAYEEVLKIRSQNPPDSPRPDIV